MHTHVIPGVPARAPFNDPNASVWAGTLTRRLPEVLALALAVLAASATMLVSSRPAGHPTSSIRSATLGVAADGRRVRAAVQVETSTRRGERLRVFWTLDGIGGARSYESRRVVGDMTSGSARTLRWEEELALPVGVYAAHAWVHAVRDGRFVPLADVAMSPARIWVAPAPGAHVTRHGPPAGPVSIRGLSAPEEWRASSPGQVTARLANASTAPQVVDVFWYLSPPGSRSPWKVAGAGVAPGVTVPAGQEIEVVVSGRSRSAGEKSLSAWVHVREGPNRSRHSDGVEFHTPVAVESSAPEGADAQKGLLGT